ncbi:MAG: ABC transporter ATP-binding protein [Planctomycetaceae bacterium]
MSVCIHVKELSHRYGQRIALDRIGLDVTRNSLSGFVGPNGGGKTTLFHLLCGLLPVQSGAIEALGMPLTGKNPAYARRIGVLFQNPGLDRRLTVRENLLHQGHLYGLRGSRLYDRATSLLERFGVAARAEETVETLSGGLKRRVELVKCLLHEPELLLLDEPSTGLDPGARHTLWNYLEELRSENAVTVVVATHLMEEAERCDELILLDRGNIAAQGRPSELRDSIQGESLRIVCDQPEKLRVRIQTEMNIELQRSGETLKLRSDKGPEILQRIMDSYGQQIRSIALDKPTLEDVFLARTGRVYSGMEGADPATDDGSTASEEGPAQ